MLYLNNFTLLILKVLLFECIIAFPNKYEVQDADTNEKFDLVNSLRDYHENNTEKEHQRNSINNGSTKSWKWMDGKWMSSQSGVKMVRCDDGKTNLTVDWDGSRKDYICSIYRGRIVTDFSITPEYYNGSLPEHYAAPHRCMSRTIDYPEAIPTFGPHRPTWPVYGEYTYLPPQRWLHSLEHGGVVMLYHPCANRLEVKKLKKLVKGCLKRYIISSNDRLNETRPLALLTWGQRLTMSYVNETIAIQFIRDTALRGAEDISDDGDFDEGLLKKVEYDPDEEDDSVPMLCSKLDGEWASRLQNRTNVTYSS